MGRATQGVTLISVDENSMLQGVRRVVESDADTDDDSIALDDNGEIVDSAQDTAATDIDDTNEQADSDSNEADGSVDSDAAQDDPEDNS